MDKALNTQKNQERAIPLKNINHGPEKIYTRKFKGKYRTIRLVIGSLIFALYFSLCWIKVDNKPILLFSLSEKKLYFFNLILWPKDMFIIAWILILSALFLFAITSFAGRVWCGYSCPQSLLSWIFIKIESIIEGDRRQRIKLDKSDLSVKKFIKKIAKHSLWFALSFSIAITFIAYFIPIYKLTYNIYQYKLSDFELFWLIFITITTYLFAAIMREKICIYLCPYSRFQSVIFNKKTLVISYNYNRGEPRGTTKKNNHSKAQGDCIDCNWCVQVCPTGIDIRKGLQYECISCAACIDACNSIMKQINRPIGLIGYTTENHLQGNTSQKIKWQSLISLIILTIASLVLYHNLTNRNSITLQILKDRNALYKQTKNGIIKNCYTLKIANKDTRHHRYEINAIGIKNLKIVGDKKPLIKMGETITMAITLSAKSKDLNQFITPIKFKIVSIDTPSISIEKEARFSSPEKNNWQSP